jgi:hypothetical protein
MDKNDLKTMWQHAHYNDPENRYDAISVEKCIRRDHCEIISRIINDMKLKILVYAIVLIIYIGLMVYAFIYLGLCLSFSSIATLTLVGLFLSIKTISEINRLFVFTKIADDWSIKESMVFFRKKLNRIKVVDFLSYLLILYSGSIVITFGYLSDIGGVKNLWSHQILPLPLLGSVLLIFLLAPWLIKFQTNRRYKELYLNLNDSAAVLDEEV